MRLLAALLSAALALAWLLADALEGGAPSVAPAPAPAAGLAVMVVAGMAAGAAGLFWARRRGLGAQVRFAFLALAAMVMALVAWPLWQRVLSPELALVASTLAAGAVAWSSTRGRDEVFAVALAATLAAAAGTVLHVAAAATLGLIAAMFDAVAVRVGVTFRLVESVTAMRIPAFVRRRDMGVGLADLTFPLIIWVAAIRISPAHGASAGLGLAAGVLWLGFGSLRRPVQAGLPWLVGGPVLGLLGAALAN